MLSKQILIVICILLIAISISANVPNVINYQGRLTDASGDPVADNTYNVKFTIYDAVVAGTDLWNSTIQPITTVDGLFTYQLGSNIALPAGIFSDTNRYLGIVIGADPEITPRTRFITSAYAFQAQNADLASDAESLNGSAPSFYLDWNNMINVPAGFADDTDDETTNASLLTSGTLADARLSGNVPLLDATNIFTGGGGMNRFEGGIEVDDNSIALRRSSLTRWSLREGGSYGFRIVQGYNDSDVLYDVNRFEITDAGDVKIGDSTFLANNTGIRIGDGDSPTSSYLLRLERNYNTSSSRTGSYSELSNDGSGQLRGLEVTVGHSADGGGATYAGRFTAYNNISTNYSRYGVRATAGSTINTAGYSYGVRTYAYGGTLTFGIYSTASSGGSGNYAGYFDGDVHVTDNLSKGGGSFKIDHPLDPEKKYLQHSFVESPDMMNIYNGNIVTDNNGFATVIMPEYFDALNKDFRYQLTVIGTFAQAIISKKIDNKQFVIQTDIPNVEVSWMVTGIRKDVWANENRIQVETDKPEHELGTYIHSKEYGMPIERDANYEHMKEDLENEANEE